MNREIEFTTSVLMVTEECYRCHVLFAFTKDLKNDLLVKRGERSFYCPNGHAQHYVGESDSQRADRLAKALEEKEARIARLDAEVDQAYTLAAQRTREARQAQLQKRALERRTSNGACGVCHRHFANVQRHYERKHPGQVVQADDA